MKIQKNTRTTVRTFISLSVFSSLLINPCLTHAQGFRMSIGGGNRYYGGGYYGGARRVNIPLGELFKSGKLRFQESVLKGDVERAARWVKPEFVDDPIKGAPPICYAAARGNARMVTLLVRNGAGIRRKYHGKSLVYIAAFYGQLRTAQTLIDLGGGTMADLIEGRAVYVKNAERQRAYAIAATGAALLLVGAMINSQSGGETDVEAQRRELRMRQGSLLAIIPGW